MIENYKLTELAAGYACNIANGRFLWRNRIGVEKIEIEVMAKNPEPNDKTWTFNALEFNMLSFDDGDKEKVKELKEEIAKTLSGKRKFLMLEINAYAKVGKAQDVYPSEELILDTKIRKGDKSKTLYEVEGVAAMHSQKIGNALRTIDTWYSDSASTMPIPVEAYGSVTHLSRAFRNTKGANFYSLLENWILKNENLSDDKKHYVVAMLIRGGVFGFGKKTK